MHLAHLLLFCYTHILLHFAAGACLRFAIYHRASEICPVNRCIDQFSDFNTSKCVAPLCILCRNFSSVCYRWNTWRWM